MDNGTFILRLVWKQESLNDIKINIDPYILQVFQKSNLTNDQNLYQIDLNDSLSKIVESIEMLQTSFNSKNLFINVEKKLWDGKKYLKKALDQILEKKQKESRNYFGDKMMKFYNQLISRKEENQISTELYYSLGCVLGAFLGDALGAYCEFKKGFEGLYEEKVVFKERNPVWGTDPGQITDDSEMALCLGMGLMDSVCEVPNFNKVAYYYGNWYLGGPYDIGNTTRKAMRTVKNIEIYKNIPSYYKEDLLVTESNYMYFEKIYLGGFLKTVKKENVSSLSNGFLMRKTPLAIFCMHYVKSEKISNMNESHISDLPSFENACVTDTMLTHFHYAPRKAALIYSIIITRIIYLRTYFPDYKQVGENTLAFLKHFLEENYKDSITNDMKDILSIIKTGKPFTMEFTPNHFYKDMCWYTLALNYAVKVLLTIDNGLLNYYGIMINVIDLGGDTDTNAAIVGGVVGAYFGPELLHKTKLETMLRFNPKLSASKHTRPSFFSPGFVMFVAERIFETRFDSLNKNKNKFSRNENVDNLPISIATLLKFFSE